MGLQQDTRLLAITTALGPDVLAVRTASIKEEISRLFEIEVELSSENGEVDFDEVIGHDATLRLDVGESDKRFFNGYVSRLVQVGNSGGFAQYKATIVPWLWLLTRTSDCRIFQKKTIPQIIEEMFQDHGFDQYRLKLSGNYEEKEYVVQYRETDFNFVSRLMEQEGIYYFFEHEEEKHTLVIADSISAHETFPNYDEITFYTAAEAASGREGITEWTIEKEVQPIACALTDFDFKKPKTSLLASSDVSRKYGKAEFEIFDYPGEYVAHGEGQRLADVRINELQTQYETVHGEGNARGIAAGAIGVQRHIAGQQIGLRERDRRIRRRGGERRRPGDRQHAVLHQVAGRIRDRQVAVDRRGREHCRPVVGQARMARRAGGVQRHRTGQEVGLGQRDRRVCRRGGER